MTSYNRIMPGQKSAHFKECFEGGFIGGDWSFAPDLTGHLSEDGRDFNAKYIPLYQKAYATDGKTPNKIAAGLACGMLWTICKGLKEGDIVLMPDGEGGYAVGSISSAYYYAGDKECLPHRRRVAWRPKRIARADMSVNLRHSTGSIGTCCDVTRYAEEIESLIRNTMGPEQAGDGDDSSGIFALEAHLEEFLIANWKNTEFGKDYDIFDDGEGQTGEQYPTDTGPLDILAVSKDKKRLLVIELKKGKTSDAAVGQILRYMSYVKEMLCEEDQTVEGAIIGLEDDQKLRRAISMVPGVSFYRYKVSFKLEQAK